MTALLTTNLPLLSSAPGGIVKLRVLIRDLAVKGRLVPQDRHAEPAHDALARIAAGRQKGAPRPTSSAVEEPYPVPSSWAWTTFDKICRIKGDLVRPEDYLDYAQVAPDCIEKGTGRLLERRTVRQSGIRGPNNKFVAGQILYSKIRPSLSKAVLVDFDGLCSADMYPIESLIHPRYQLLAMLSEMFLAQVRIAENRVKMPKLNQESLNAFAFPVPPLEEQHRIVAKVDELMALCDRLEAEQADAEAAHAKLVEALLASLTQARDAADFRASWQQLAEHFHTLFTTDASVDALKQTIVHLAVMGKLVAPVEGEASASDFLAEIDAARAEYEAMPGQRSRLRGERGEPMAPPPYPAPAGWEWRNLGSLLLITGGVTLGRKLAGREVVSLSYLRVANVQRGFLVLDQIKEVEVPADEVEKYKLAPGDLLTTEGGDWDKVGRTAIWRGEIAQCLHQNHVFRSRPYTEKFSSRWVELYLNSPPARDYFAGSSKQTTNLASINMTQLRACAFPVPPLATQHRIVTKVNELLALCEQLKAGIAAARAQHAHLAEALVKQAVAA